MARGIRVVVLNCDESYAVPLRAKLLKHDGVKIVAEVDEPALFASTLEQFPAELAVVNLDPDPEGLTALADGMVHARPDLCLYAVSASEDANLILQAMRAGFKEFLLWPIEDDQLRQALERLAKTAPAHAASGRLICVLGPTGGCGATTIATNFACELSLLSRKRTALVDLDFAYGHVATLLDVSPQFTIADLCQTLDSIDPSMIEKALVRHEESDVHVLARPQHLSQAEHISAANVSNVLSLLCEMFDYVVCDGPSRHDATVSTILDLADVTMMVLNLVVPAVRNVDRILQELTNRGYNMDRLHLVVNRRNSDSTMLDVADVEQCLGRQVRFIVPEDGRTVATSINMGLPLCHSAPKSRIREAIRQLAEIIHDPDGNGKTPPAGRTGLLAKVLGK